jgi:hypothetical protein
MNRRHFLLIAAGAALAPKGVLRLRAAEVGGPAVVPATDLAELFAGLRLYWGDIHGHTGFSDAYGGPAEYYDHARRVKRLDFSAITDHAEWINFFSAKLKMHDGRPLPLWTMTLDEADRQTVSGTFVAMPAVEWTNDTFGHRCLYFRDRVSCPPVPPSAVSHRTPPDLWAALPVGKAITIPHHPTRWGKLTDWSQIDARFDRQVEIYSKWGNGASVWTGYEPPVTYRRYPEARGLARESGVDAMLLRGHRIGIIASTDTHQGLPGSTSADKPRGITLSKALYPRDGEGFLYYIENGFTFDHREPNGGGGGLAGVWASALTRPGIFDALYGRTTCGTTGPRPVIQFGVRDGANTGNAAIQGQELTVAGAPTFDVAVWPEAQCAVTQIQLLKDNALIASLDRPQPGTAMRFTDTGLSGSQAACYRVLVLLKQEELGNADGDRVLHYDAAANRFYHDNRQQLAEQAWTSPIWVARG